MDQAYEHYLSAQDELERGDWLTIGALLTVAVSTLAACAFALIG